MSGAEDPRAASVGRVVMAPYPLPDPAPDDVHVDWHMTREEYGQLRDALLCRLDLPYVKALYRAGKLEEQ